MSSYFGSVGHPVVMPDVLVSGGSSGGSAVAVATGMCDLYVSKEMNI